MKVVADIETDSLDATIVHCIVCKDIDNGKVYRFRQDECYREFPDFAANVTTWIGHNFLSFDAPVLNRLLGTNIKEENIFDTLVLSRLFNSTRKGHSLADWGVTLGFPKQDFHSFDVYTEQMLEYCENDVEVCYRIWNHLKEKEAAGFTHFSIRLEHKFVDVLNRMKRDGFEFDVKTAMELLAKIETEANNLLRQLQEDFPPLPKAVREYVPRRNKDGSIAKASCGGIETSLVEAGCPYTKIEWAPFNPASPSQIVARLSPYWSPTVKTKSGNSFKVCEENLETLSEEAPKSCHELTRYLLLRNRVARLQEWLGALGRDNRVHGDIFHIGTTTHRCSHQRPNMANVPAIHDRKGRPALYGAECRSLWTVRKGYKLIGTDASGIQLRGLAHYLNAPEYTQAVVSGDIHTTNLLNLGIDKGEWDENKQQWSARSKAKTFIYAWLLGASAPKISSVLGVSVPEATSAMERFVRNTPGLAALLKYKSAVARTGWLDAIDGRRIPIESDHKALSVFLQSFEAIVMRVAFIYWTREADRRKIDYKLCAFVHDEWQTEVEENRAEELGALQVYSIQWAGQYLKSNCPLTGEYKIGNNWKETH